MRDDEISARLDLVPMFSYAAGDAKMTPKGTQLPGIRRQTFWSHRFPGSAACVEDEIDAINAVLSDKRDFLRLIYSGGGRIEYFIGLFDINNSGLTLGHETLKNTADLSIDLTFDLYVKGVEAAREEIQ